MREDLANSEREKTSTQQSYDAYRASATADAESARADRLASETALNDKIVELQGIRMSMGDAVEELSREIEELQETVRTLEADVAKKETEIAEKTELSKQLQTTLDEQGVELGNALAQLDADLNRTRDTLEETKKARDGLQADLDKTRQELSETKNTLEQQVRAQLLRDGFSPLNQIFSVSCAS